MSDAPNLLEASNDDLREMGLPPAFTLADLQAALSDEEIQKLAEGDDPIITLPDDMKAKPQPQDDDPDDDSDGEDDDDSDDEAEAEAGDAAEAAEADKTDETPDPVYQPIDTASHKAVVDGAAAERKALRDAYDDGELTGEEYDAKVDEIADKVADAKAAIKTAEKDEADQLAAYQGAWYGKVDAFLEANPVFKDKEPRPELQGDSYEKAFDTVLRAINTDARYVGMTMAQRIEAGSQIVRAYVQKQTGADIPGIAESKPAPKAKADDARARAAKKAADQGKRPDPVQTLGNVTAATETEADNSRYATIDREKAGLAREREFSRLTPEEQEAYLRGE